MLTLVLRKVLDFSDLPQEWSVVRLAADWHGQPIVLIAEGKPERPKPPCDAEGWEAWRRAPPRAHHVLYLEEGALRQVRLEDSGGPFTFNVQPVEDGWLVGERWGSFSLYDRKGVRRKSLDLGNGSDDVQTTPDGRIWISYFGRPGSGRDIGKSGVVCFDLQGRPIFRYAEFAEQNGLPFSSDCYAMNVDISGNVWLNYDAGPALIHMKGDAIEKVWLQFGYVGSDFAVRNGLVIYSRSSKLMGRSLVPPEGSIDVDLRDESGRSLIPVDSHHLGIAGRGKAMLINTGSAIYGID